ncbi:MAG: MBL fold metallo-hydrolase [Solirubrobacteraceae bacterium]|nr:MAG: MBL fold metallo-hydrolase [Solirubrobacterales bacterium]
MRAVGLHGDVIVVTSRVWRTTATAVRCGKEAFVIDSVVYPDELDALAGLTERAGFDVRGLLATHADWDHLLALLAFPEASLGVAESSAERLAAESGAAQRELRDFDDRHYVERTGPLALAAVQPLPVPGRCALGERELELHRADGHTADGMAVWIPWARALICGDYLSPVEIPMISAGGSAGAYRATLGRLAPLVEQAEWVVPGHGGPLDGAKAAAILSEDLDYLDALASDGPKATLPVGRRSPQQRRHNAANAERAGASSAA